MTVDEVRREIEEIRAARADAVMAHEAEDALRRRVLAAIAAGAPNAAEIAAAALATDEIPFSRSCS
jgi:ketosteroid isomerase-like protein